MSQIAGYPVWQSSPHWKRKAFRSLVLPIASLGAVPCSAGFFGPSSFDECILNEMKNAKTDVAAKAILFACRAKFPSKDQAPTEPSPKYETPADWRISALGTGKWGIYEQIKKLEVRKLKSVEGSSGTGYYTVLEITNKNDFPIVGVEISVLRAKERKCDWSDDSYAEIYSCFGSVTSMASGSLRCEMPDVHSRNINFCLTGFYINGTKERIDRFIAEKSIQKRP